ncbi:MAG TPA: geranylgeranylglycerol-phosphate geranylgeranyltransferase [Flavisolibacter sp.]
MKLISAFLQVIRWPNLVFIILAQLLFYFCVYVPLFDTPAPATLGWLIVASVLIAAAGYIINDYFDLNIDQVNKPDKNVFIKTVNRRSAIIWHFMLSLAGVAATFYAVGWHKWYIILANAGCVVLLWVYSTSLKRQLLIGNIVISLLTAWTILVLFFAFTEPQQALAGSTQESVKFFRIAFLYGAFAFIISLVREAIKDMQDLEGDARYGCRTLPVVAGIRVTRIYTSIWMIVLLASLVILQLYVLQFGWWPAILYSVVAVILPLIYGMSLLSRARTSREFGLLSGLTKIIMFTGIFSMIFFRIYLR